MLLKNFCMCLVAIALILGCGAFGKPKLGLPDCSQASYSLINVLTVACNNIGNGTNATLRDACVGCFQTASTANSYQPSLTQLSACATMYMTNTNYSRCITNIQGSAANAIFTTGIGQCATGYCGFVRCIRSVNANILISACYNASRLINDAMYPDQQVGLYKNITSCILARSRCSALNPITGQNNSNFLVTPNKFPKLPPRVTPLSNTLQLSQSGELRIVSLPTLTSVRPSFCGSTNNLKQSIWQNFTC